MGKSEQKRMSFDKNPSSSMYDLISVFESVLNQRYLFQNYKKLKKHSSWDYSTSSKDKREKETRLPRSCIPSRVFILVTFWTFPRERRTLKFVYGALTKATTRDSKSLQLETEPTESETNRLNSF